MTRYTSNKRVIGGRIARLRRDNSMEQKDLCEKIIKMLSGKSTITVSLISAWENGRRPVATKYNKILASIFSVTEEYLLGLTNDYSSNMATEVVKENALYEIKAEELSNYDGLPIWVVFETLEFQNAWAIYDATSNKLMFKDGIKKIQRMRDVRFYSQVPDFEYGIMKDRRALEYSQVIRSKRIYVQMLTFDASIKALYNGWYIHNETSSALIQPWSGLVLPYEGINVSYRAYSMGDPLKTITE